MSPKKEFVFPAQALALLRSAAAQLPAPLYLVGGALRDAWLGRPLWDLDLALRGARDAAARLARSWGATFVVLDADNGVFRLMLPEGRGVRQVDLSELQGDDIEADLRRRDFTVNALALSLTPDLADRVPVQAVLDPRGGLADLDRAALRCEDEEVLKADPLRILRAFRLGAQLGFDIEARTLKRLRDQRCRIRRSAPERIAAELTLLLSEPGCGAWIKRLDEAEVLTAIFEDLESARQCATCYYGAGGVLRHTLEVTARLDLLLTDFRRVFSDTAGPLAESLGERLRPGHPWRAALMLAALLHDVSKAETARRMGGRLRFFGHDVEGARRSAAILKALRFSNETVDLVATVATHHLRPGNLAAGGALTDKAVYRFFRDLGPQAVAVLLVCWADHASYLPEKQLARLLPSAAADPEAFDFTTIRPVEARKTLRHLQVIAQLMRRHFDTERRPVPERLIDGRELMKALGLPPGPKVGELLERLREAQAEGKVVTKKDALDYIKRLK